MAVAVRRTQMTLGTNASGAVAGAWMLVSVT